MSQVITITGVTLAAGSAQTLELATLFLPPIKSILKADQIINPHTHVFAGTVATPAGTVAAPVFTGAALAAHSHVTHFQTGAAANAVTAAANALRTAAAAFDVAGVADSVGEGGVVNIAAGTPAGTNSAPAFTGTAATPAGTNAAAQPTRVALGIATAIPIAADRIYRVGDTTLSLWLTTAMTVDDMLVLTIEPVGGIVRP